VTLLYGNFCQKEIIMKKTFFITLFIVTHIGFFFLQIQKQMETIKESFRKQDNERTLAQLEQKKQALHNELQMLQNKQIIKEFAQNSLKLHPITLSQIHRPAP
jgi:cell division protein FtsB